MEKFYRYSDPGGRRYKLDNMLRPGGAAKGNPSYEVMGVTRYWRYSEKRMADLIRAPAEKLHALSDGLTCAGVSKWTTHTLKVVQSEATNHRIQIIERRQSTICANLRYVQPTGCTVQ